MNEAALQAKLLNYMTKNGIMGFKIESRSFRGLPDLFCIRGGITVFIEVKSPSGKGRLSALQKRRIAQLRAQGAIVYDCSNYEEGVAILQRHFPEPAQND